MRQIEFRCFDKDRNEYLSAGSVSIEILSGKSPVNRIILDCSMDVSNKDRFTLEQFTGLKDRDGVKIFEGDIVKTDYYTGTPGSFKRIIGQVSYLAPSFRVCGIRQYDGLRKELHGLSTVIGNVHDKAFIKDQESNQ